MADKKISELAAAGALTGAELVELVQGGVNKQTTTQDIANLGGGGGGAVDSVNGQTGAVVLDAADVGADPSGSAAAVDADLDAHISDATAAHDATAISNTPAGNISATTVQAAINELDTEKQLLVNSSTALVDGATIDLTAIKHTLSSSAATRTFTISYTGDDITMVVTLSATSATYTFPAASLCVSEGAASGDNTCVLAGVSGDIYVFAIKRVGSAFYVVCKNFGQ